MPTTDPRIDAYIDRAAPFAQPILRHLRAAVHATCPDVVETVKWGMPHFEHKGVLCSFAAFKEHCSFGFWRGSEVIEGSAPGMGSFGKITSLADLPADAELAALIAKAVAINESGTKAPRPVKHPKPPLAIPAELTAALDGHPEARANFDAFPPSHKRDYADWIVEAKTAETKRRRIEQAVAQIAERKSRNWKYERG